MKINFKRRWHYQIAEPVFNTTLDLYVGYTEKEWLDRLKPFDIDLEIHGSTARTIQKNKISSIWINPKSIVSEEGFICALTHEIVHLGVGHMVNRNIPVNEHVDEVLAYIVEFYMRNCIMVLKK